MSIRTRTLKIANAISCFFLRPNRLSSSAPQNKNKTPTEVLEALERWSARATFAILIGVVLEAVNTIYFRRPDETLWEITAGISADALIGIALAIEAYCILRAIIETRKEKRESDEKIAEANVRAAEADQKAAEARERTAEIERFTAFRRISHDQLTKVRAALVELHGKIDLLIEYQYGSTEAYVYARDLSVTFSAIGIVRIVPNSLMETTAFGLFVTSAPSIDIELVAKALIDAEIEFGRITGMDLSKHLSRNVSAPNLYMFVAPKPPPALISPAISPISTAQNTIPRE